MKKIKLNCAATMEAAQLNLIIIIITDILIFKISIKNQAHRRK